MAGLHRECDWNEAHEVVPVSQDRDTSNKTAINDSSNKNTV